MKASFHQFSNIVGFETSINETPRRPQMFAKRAITLQDQSKVAGSECNRRRTTNTAHRSNSALFQKVTKKTMLQGVGSY